MPDLTAPQQSFVDELVATGCTPTEAARRAGYRHPGQEAYRLMRNRHVLGAVKDLQNRLISGFGCNVALKTLLEVMGDKAAPASARVSAARAMFDAGGLMSKSDERAEEKQLHEMTNDELSAFIERCDRTIAAGGEPPVIRLTDATH